MTIRLTTELAHALRPDCRGTAALGAQTRYLPSNEAGAYFELT